MLRSRTEEGASARALSTNAAVSTAAPPVKRIQATTPVKALPGQNAALHFPDGVVHRVEGAHVIADATLLLMLYTLSLFLSRMPVAELWQALPTMVVLDLLSCVLVAGQRRQPTRVRTLRMLWISLNVSCLLAALCLCFGEYPQLAASLFGANLAVAGIGTWASIYIVPYRNRRSL